MYNEQKTNRKTLSLYQLSMTLRVECTNKDHVNPRINNVFANIQFAAHIAAKITKSYY